MKTGRCLVVAGLVSLMVSGCSAYDDVAGEDNGLIQPAQSVQGEASSMPADSPRNALPLPPPLETTRLVGAEIVDGSGFGRPVTAWRLQIPAGWETTGGVTWSDNANCYSNMVQTAWSAIGPDSLSVIEITPNFGWQVAGTQVQTDPCPVAPFRSVREFLQAAVKQSRPDARILDYVDRADWAQEAQRQGERQMREMGISLPPGQTRRIEAGSLLLAFQQDGIEMREMLSAMVSFTDMHGNVSGLANGVMSYRAPNGRLDLDLVERVAGTMQQDPQWQSMALPRLKRNIGQYYGTQRRKIDEWHNRQMAIINARGMADRHAIRMRGNKEVAGIYSAIAANTATTNDNMHRRGLEAIGEYNTYAGVEGTSVQSSIHGGSQVFQSQDDPSRAYSTDAPYPNPPDGYVELQREP